MATYVGLVMYIVLYGGYVVYERVGLGRRGHLVPLLEVDLETDAVWKAGDAVRLREEDERRDGDARGGAWWRRVWREVVSW